MTSKEELEILRGEPIKVFTGDPMNIPCIETSDRDKLCKHPLVSVHMITYNHEPYIRQAIEGVMMQKADFEFELIIGEDCSQDKTREICFEYQKKHPDKIRVLWWHENSYKNMHPAGGNSQRVMARCRGEFIALCEGDDYWIDPLKLQKQVDIMRQHSSVGLCFTGAQIFYQESKSWCRWNEGGAVPSGFLSGRDYFNLFMFGKDPSRPNVGDEGSVMTASRLIRRSAYDEAVRRYDIFSWRLALGDTTQLLALSLVSDVYHLPDETVVYRKHRGGVSCKESSLLSIDGRVVRVYFAVKEFKLNLSRLPIKFTQDMCSAICRRISNKSAAEQRVWSKKFRRTRVLAKIFTPPENWIYWLVLRLGFVSALTLRLLEGWTQLFSRTRWRVPRLYKMGSVYEG